MACNPSASEGDGSVYDVFHGTRAHPADPDRRIVVADGNEVSVGELSFRDAAATVVEFHYMHRRPTMSFAFGLLDGDKNILGALTYGVPASRQLQLSACPSSADAVIELNRMWVSDELPKGLTTWFIARTLRRLPPRIVVSYADTIQGHMGYVYRAANFHYAGWTDMERKTARYDYIPLHEGAHTREAFRTGYGSKVRRRPKVKYWTVTGNKRQRRNLTAACAWPVMDWRLEPPPTEHRQRRVPHVPDR